MGKTSHNDFKFSHDMSLTAFNSKKKGRTKWKVLTAIVLLLLSIRILLPYLVLYYSNQKLARMNGYFGHINDIELSLYRGAYVINDFYIDKIDTTSHSKIPFISSKKIDLSVEWKSLFLGRLVGEMDFYNPVMRFTKDKAEPFEIQKDTNDFRIILKTFMPLKINRFEIFNGKIQYIDYSSNPVVDLSMNQAHVLAQNLSNVENKSVLPADVVATANLYGGKLNFKMKLDPFAKRPAFDMNAELKNTPLSELNTFFKAYAKFDINTGSVGLYTEIAGKNGNFIGYVKPIMKDLDIVGPEDADDGFLNKVWERIIGATGVLLKNRKKDQVATKIPIEGKFGVTTYGTWYAVVSLLQNAFIQAISPAIDNQINIVSVKEINKDGKKTGFKKIFDSSHGNKKKKEKRQDK